MAAVILALGSTSQDTAALARHPIYGSRPLLRGRFHQAAALVSIPVGHHLITRVAAPGARVETLAYALTCTLMFATSATYHRIAEGVTARFWMRRLDHSMILIHIAGGTTPIALLGVGGSAGGTLLVATWTGALVGTTMKMTRLTADHDPCPWLFPVLGWLPLLALPSVTVTLGWEGAAFLVASMATYTAGAICFDRKSPDPVPTIFGYHEVWHVFTLLAGGLQLLLTIRLVSI